MGDASLTECKEVVCWYRWVTSKYIFAMKLLEPDWPKSGMGIAGL